MQGSHVPLSTSKPGNSGHPLPGWTPPPLGPAWIKDKTDKSVSKYPITATQTNVLEYVSLFFTNWCGFQGDLPCKSQHTHASSELQAWWLCCTSVTSLQSLLCLLAEYQAVVPRARLHQCPEYPPQRASAVSVPK